MKAPTEIETARLTLMRPAPGDAANVFERYAGDKDVTRFLGWPRHRSVADTEAFLTFSVSEWERWPAGPYLIRSRHDGRLLGGTGLAFDASDHAVTGYVLARDAWGLGYATEALTAIAAPPLALELRGCPRSVIRNITPPGACSKSAGSRVTAPGPDKQNFPTSLPACCRMSFATRSSCTVLRGRGLELVDASGRVRAQFNVEPDGEAVFRMRDTSGTIRVKLGAGDNGSGLLLIDETTEPGVQIIARRSAAPAHPTTTSINLSGADGKRRTIAP
jgi:hypothetical protein